MDRSYVHFLGESVGRPMERGKQKETLTGTPQGGIVTLPTKLRKACESFRRVCHVTNSVRATAKGCSAPRFQAGRARTYPRHRRKETLVARRTRHHPARREMHTTFAPGRLRLTWVAQADEQIVPIGRRTTSKAPGPGRDGLAACETDSAQQTAAFEKPSTLLSIRLRCAGWRAKPP